jgi:hypothetical protein
MVNRKKVSIIQHGEAVENKKTLDSFLGEIKKEGQ